MVMLCCSQHRRLNGIGVNAQEDIFQLVEIARVVLV